MSATQGLVRDSASLASGQVALLAATAVVSLLSARWLGPEGKGELALAFAMAALLGPIAAGGVDTFVATRSSSVSAAGRRSVRHFALCVGWLGGLGLALATAAYGIVMGLSGAVVALTALGAALRPSIAVRQALRIAGGRVAELGWVALAMALVHVAVVAALAIDGATASDFALAAAMPLLLGLMLLRMGRPPGDASEPVAPLDRGTRREMIRFGGSTVLADGLQLANYRIDLFILAAFVPLPTIGVYAVAAMLAEILWQVPNAVSRSLMARVAAGDAGRSDAVRISYRLAPVTGGLAVLGAAITYILIGPLVGASYRPTAGLLALLLPGVVVLGATKPLAAWTLSQGYPARNLAASGGGFFVVIAANLLLIPRFGAAGAAVASTLSYITTAIAIVALLPASADQENMGRALLIRDAPAPAAS